MKYLISILLFGTLLLNVSCKDDEPTSPADIQSPKVVSMIPNADAKEVDLGASIQATFDESLLLETSSNSAVTLSNTHATVDGIVVFSPDSKTIYFIPNNKLEMNTNYDVIINKSFTDASLNPIDELKWSFSTIGDVQPPNFIERAPISNAVEIDIASKIEIVFDEPLNQATIETAFSLLNAETKVEGNLNYDPQLSKITFTPSAVLEFNTLYNVQISNSLLDTAQNAIQAIDWSFTTAPERGPAKYMVTFEATWSAATHPTDFPSSPHFSGLIGMTHSSDTALFYNDTFASTGIKNMAEGGSKGSMTTEIQQIIAKGKAENIISGVGVGVSPGNVSLEFDISLAHSLVSITSMIAPSPDWFIAIHDVNLYEGGKWSKELTVPVGSYDSGTDSGTTFTSANLASNPLEKIFLIKDTPLAVNGEVQPLGQIVFKRIN